MSHIIDFCPVTKLAGGLSKLHSTGDNTVAWLANYAAHRGHTHDNNK